METPLLMVKNASINVSSGVLYLARRAVVQFSTKIYGQAIRTILPFSRRTVLDTRQLCVFCTVLDAQF